MTVALRLLQRKVKVGGGRGHESVYVRAAQARREQTPENCSMKIVRCPVAIGFVVAALCMSCSDAHDGDTQAMSSGGRSAATRSSAGSTAAAAGTAASSASGRGAAGTRAPSGSATGGTAATPAMPVRCQTPGCQLNCPEGAGCSVECGANCRFSTSNRAPVPSLTATCGTGCKGECGRGVQTCNVQCTGDCSVECESATCNISCAAGAARACPDGESYVCGATACEEEDESEADAGA